MILEERTIMARMIRCIEGHVFDRSGGRCPLCGWTVPPAKMGLVDRLKSMPSDLLMNATAVQDSPGGGGAAILAGEPELHPLKSLLALLILLLRSRAVWIVIAITVVIALLVSDITGSELDRVSASQAYLRACVALMLAGFILGMKALLRSNVSVILLLYGFLQNSP